MLDVTWHHCDILLLMYFLKFQLKKSAQREANTARALAVVRFGHRPPARCHKPADRTDYNILRSISTLVTWPRPRPFWRFVFHTQAGCVVRLCTKF